MFDYDLLEDIEPSSAPVAPPAPRVSQAPSAASSDPPQGVAEAASAVRSYSLLLGQSQRIVPRGFEVEVEVSTIGAGVVARFRVPWPGLVDDVRRELEKRRGVAAAEQRLLHGTTVLDASESLAELTRGAAGPLQLTLVHVPGAQRVVLSGGREGPTLLWDLRHGESIQRLAAEGSHATCVELSWPRRRALTGGSDGLLRLWSLEKASVLRALRGRGAAVTCLAADWEAQRAVSGYKDGSIRYWDLETCATITELTGHVDAVLCVAFDVKEQRAVSGGLDCTLTLWDLEEGEATIHLEGHVMPINCVAAKLDLKPEPIAVTGSFGILRVWTLSRFPFYWDFPGQAAAVTCSSVDWGTMSVLCGSVDATLLCGKMNMNANAIDGKKWLRGHNAPVNCLAADWARQRAASGGEDGMVRVWDLRHGRALHALRGHGDGVLCVALSLDGRDDEDYEDGDALALAPVSRDFLSFARAQPGEFAATMVQDGLLEDLQDLLTSQPNLAHCCAATASSSKSSSRAASFAVDGRRSTRWTSAYHDDQWLCVDLAKPCKVSRVDIKWEAAYAKSYALQGSLDGEVWTPLATEEGREGWVVTELPSDTCVRWLRMYGHTRATKFGFSVFALCAF